MLSSGLKYEFGSLEESLTSLAIERQAEVEYLKVLAIIAAINNVGNQVSAALAGQGYSGSEALKDALDSLSGKLFPRLAENKEAKAAEVKKTLEEEAKRGTIQIKVMERETDRRRRKG